MSFRTWFASKIAPLAEPFPDAKQDVVVSYDTATIYSVNAGQRYNPDDLVGMKGLPIYSRMMVDEQVKSVTEFKLNAILGRGYDFKFAGTKLSKEEQQQRIDVFQEALRKMRGSFVDALEGIASGREYGFSVTEKVYGKVQVDGKEFVGINMLLTRDPCAFEFYADEYGMLNKILQRANGQPKIPIERTKIIHYVHKPKWDMIFGRSELRSAYRSWYAKEQLIKLWLLHLEKFGSGIPVATRTGENSGSSYGSPEYTNFQSVMANFKAFTSIILPPGFTAEVVFPTSTDQFEKAIQYHDLAIAKSQLVPNLLGLSVSGQTGAFAQSQTQLEAFFWTTGADGARLSECLNEDLFRDLGDQNWADGDYPLFCFKPISLEHTKWMIETWVKLLGAGAVLTTEEDERVLRQMLDMAERAPDEKQLVDPMKEREMKLKEDGLKQTGDLGKAAIDAKAKEKSAALSATPVNVTQTVHNPAPVQQALANTDADATGAVVVHCQHGACRNMAAFSWNGLWCAEHEPAHRGPLHAVHPHGKLVCSMFQLTKAAQRVAFSVIEKRTDDYTVAAVNNMAGIVAKAVKRALGDDAALRLLVDDDPSDVAALDLSAADRSKLKGASRELLNQAWRLGSDMASNELDRARGERTSMSARKVKLASLRDNASAYFDTQSFRMAGDASDQTRKIIQQELQNAIKQGKPLVEVRTSIWERLVAKGLTKREAVLGIETDSAVNAALDALWLDQVEDVAAYLDTVVRTNTFEALNEARFAEFTDPAVSEFVEAMQYAAVLDSSTTEICTALGTGGTNGEGVIFKADSDVWDQFRPPNHFNCRSVLIPITTIDGWDGVESPEPTVEPQDGFK